MSKFSVEAAEAWGRCGQVAGSWRGNEAPLAAAKRQAEAEARHYAAQDTLKADAIDPPHYRSHPSGVECIAITEHMNFTLGNAVKYIWRASLKGRQVEDLKKARWYLDREIARLEPQRNLRDELMKAMSGK